MSGLDVLTVALVAERTLEDDVEGEKADGVKQLHRLLPGCSCGPLVEQNLHTAVVHRYILL